MKKKSSPPSNMPKKKEVAKLDSHLPAQTPEELISRAIDKGTPVDVMERILAMRKELKQEKSQEEYNYAMSQFQNECPVIEKKSVVKNKDGRSIRYKYAKIESIVDQIKPILKKYGFSYTVDTQVEDGWVSAKVKVIHTAGHSETSTFRVPTENSQYMNKSQNFASALTFAKRYAFCNAFGILTGDEDIDTNVPADPLQVAIDMIKREKDKNTLNKWKEEFAKSTKYNDAQKATINSAINKRLGI